MSYNLSNCGIIDSVFKYKNCNACKACFLDVPLNWPALPGLLFSAGESNSGLGSGAGFCTPVA